MGDNQTAKRNLISALMIDLDGTILGSGPVSPRVANAIINVSQHLPVSIATGREAPDVLYYARQLGLVAPQICDGGATALDPADGSRIWDSVLPEEQAQIIVASLESRNTPFIATHRDFSATRREEIASWGLTRISAMDITGPVADDLVGQFDGNLDLNVVKVFLYYNRLWAVDFTPSGVDKGMAAGKLAGLMGISTSQIGAIGDSYNDLPMLRICGLSVAMGDAPQEVKDAADYVAPSVEEDGLVFAIEEFVLPRLAQ